MLFRDETHQVLFLTLGNRSWDSYISLFVFFRAFVLVFPFFINNKVTREFNR